MFKPDHRVPKQARPKVIALYVIRALLEDGSAGVRILKGILEGKTGEEQRLPEEKERLRILAMVPLDGTDIPIRVDGLVRGKYRVWWSDYSGYTYESRRNLGVFDFMADQYDYSLKHHETPMPVINQISMLSKFLSK